jgi:hypothetical protein
VSPLTFRGSCHRAFEIKEVLGQQSLTEAGKQEVQVMELQRDGLCKSKTEKMQRQKRERKKEWDFECTKDSQGQPGTGTTSRRSRVPSGKHATGSYNLIKLVTLQCTVRSLPV